MGRKTLNQLQTVRVSPMLRVFGRRWRTTRRGTTAVESALVLPIFLMFVLGLVELSRAVLIQHVLNSACRKAARFGSTEGSTTAAVKAKALQVLASAVDPNKVTVYVKSATSFDGGSPGTSASALEAMPDAEVSNLEPRQLFMVRAKVKYKDVAMVNKIPFLGNFLKNVTLDGQAFMRHE
jgi:Flp pilus assembly protein TadG